MTKGAVLGSGLALTLGALGWCCLSTDSGSEVDLRQVRRAVKALLPTYRVYVETDTELQPRVRQALLTAADTLEALVERGEGADLRQRLRNAFAVVATNLREYLAADEALTSQERLLTLSALASAEVLVGQFIDRLELDGLQEEIDDAVQEREAAEVPGGS